MAARNSPPVVSASKSRSPLPTFEGPRVDESRPFELDGSLSSANELAELRVVVELRFRPGLVGDPRFHEVARWQLDRSKHW
jgi:hypothetical protein